MLQRYATNPIEEYILPVKIGDIISPTMDYRLVEGIAEFQGISDREFISFIIEVDWFYQR